MATVLFFGELKEICGASSMEISVGDVDTLQRHLNHKWPELSLRTITISVNKNIISENMVLNNGDEVAFMPPFSGG